MDAVYASPPRSAQDERHRAPPAGSSINVQLRERTLRLREDHAQAVRMGTSPLPLLAIQAAYGTGKPVVGAYIAAQLAQPVQLVVATATTNVAVAQFVDTLLAIEGNQHNVTALRFVADSALQEGAPTTAVDLHRILTGLLVNYSDSLSPHEQERLHQ
ncbi:unnamed protein product [Haemonchus placei]|uniref:ResIII domain-containing protein n=1 Tax=Haemonchus placei TaxID=6290 RepID=A0A0N4XAM4_HAEPC|nr:unnamed protein product [Haemonchus placei]